MRISKCLGPECKGGREKIIEITRPEILSEVERFQNGKLRRKDKNDCFV